MAQKFGTNEEVIATFVAMNGYPCKNSVGSVSHENGILYSYREPICIRQENGMYIVNGDKWSVTTSQHQSTLQSRLRMSGKNFFTTSFSAMERFIGGVSSISLHYSTKGLFAERMRDEVNVVDHTDDFVAIYDESSGLFRQGFTCYKKENLPQGAEIRYRKDPETGENIPTVAHMAGSVLFEYNGECVIASMDEMQYFVSILPRPVNFVGKAFASLKPEEVLDAEKKGLEIFRQGEWFFIPHLIGKEAREQYNQMETDFKLVGRNGGNPHKATRGVWLDEQRGIAEVSGRIRHDEHRMLQLSTYNDPVIYVAVENTAVRSFSAMGRVD